jgi:hypothetical protein
VHADEGGVGFWLPGQMGSFAAVPSEPGWSLPVFYYHASTEAGGEKSFARGGRITAGVDGRADFLFTAPTYTMDGTVAGGAQLSAGVGIAVARMNVGVHATLSGPNGNIISGSESDRLDGMADLYPMVELKWNQGVHNYMAYTMLGVPSGSYKAGRLANVGLGHWSIDGGGGYTYLDTKAGHEVSVVGGLTYNFTNSDTDYQNGIDMHVDFAASQFFSPQVHAGVVGYWYQQVTGDSGSGATLGDFKSRVVGLGPQVGYFFPVGGKKWYANTKVIWEFAEKNRAAGWNFWLVLDMPLGGP